MDISTKRRQPNPIIGLGKQGYDRSGQVMVEFFPAGMLVETACPECGAPAVNGRSCRELYEELLELESRDPKGAGRVHTLSVLCYVVQHPRDYSNDALNWGITSLRDLVQNGHKREQSRPRPKRIFNLFRRKPKTIQPDRPAMPNRWGMTIEQVYRPDPYGHPERVKQWARSILTDFEGVASG